MTHNAAIYEVHTCKAASGESPEGLSEKMREHVWTWKFIGEFSKSSCKTQCHHTMIHSDKFTSKSQRKVAMCGRKRPGVAIATKGFFLCDGIATLRSGLSAVLISWLRQRGTEAD